jgi:hypothetical protein
MACYTVGCAEPAPQGEAGGGAALDTMMPPEDANV